MPLLDVTPRLRELGRIRTGVTVEGTSKSGKRFKRPEKLATFRLTSPSEALVRAAQAVYDGTVEPWDSPAGRQFELVTKVDVLPIVIPSGESLSQWYELWAAGGCQRRCDGRTEVLSDGPCLCPSDTAERRELAGRQTPEACKPTTRLNVVLPDLPDLGVWRLESHGYYAAVELAGAAQFLAMATSAGMNIPAFLRLEQREKKVPGQPTNRYAVPVIEFTHTRITDLIAAGAGPTMLGDATPAPQLVPGALIPTKAPRTRQPKVDRPALGPAPAVPDGSDFGRRQAVTPTAPPPGVPEEPEEVTGWRIAGDHEASDARPDDGPSRAGTASSRTASSPSSRTRPTTTGAPSRPSRNGAESTTAGSSASIEPDDDEVIEASTHLDMPGSGSPMTPPPQNTDSSWNGPSDDPSGVVSRSTTRTPTSSTTDQRTSSSGSARSLTASAHSTSPAHTADADTSTEDIVEGEVREVPGLTRDELVEGLRAIGVTTGAAAQKSQAMWPDRPKDVALSDAQRAELLAALREETATAAAL